MSNFIIGLTGGIGSGKTTVANLFADLGIELVDADIIARQVVAKGSAGLQQIQQHFGASVLLDTGELNRPALREKVFNQPEQRLWLNNLLHPMIRQQMLQAVADAKSIYVIMVVPLLFENGLDRLVNTTLVVDIPPHEQIARTAKRDGVDSTQVEQIINSQIDREQRLQKADAIIDNTQTPEALRHTVQLLHQQYLDKASQDNNNE
ncbi:dephospho-CoA kinase [Pseudomonadota bacterium]